MSETGDEWEESSEETSTEEEKEENLDEVSEETNDKSPLDWDYEDPNADSTGNYTLDWEKIVSEDGDNDELDNNSEDFQENQDSQNTILVSEMDENDVEKEIENEEDNDDEIQSDDVDELPEELTDPEKIQALWEKYEELEREGISPEEIKDIMQEAERSYEAFKEEAAHREQEEYNKLEQVDQENEEKSEDYPEEIVKSDEAQEVVNTVDHLAEKGKTEEEIIEELEFPKEEELVSDDQYDEEEAEDYKEEIGNPAQMQDYIDTIKKMDKEGKTKEEIVKELEDEEKSDIFKEKLDILHEKEVQESLKQVNHLNEEEEEDYKEEIDKPTAMQEIVDDVENQVDREEEGETVEKSTEKEVLDGFKEQVKNLHDQEVQENLKQVNHSDEEEQDNFPEEIKTQKEFEQFMAKLDEEGEVQEEKKSCEENQNIEQVQEKSTGASRGTNEEDEIKEIEEEVELIENGGLVSLQVISGEPNEVEKSEVEVPEEKAKEIEDEEFEKLKKLYQKNTGKRTKYAGKETKGFSQWLKELVKESQELVEQFKEKEEEEWQKFLLIWIDEATEEELSAELKEILTEILHKHEFYEEIREIIPEFKMLIEKFNQRDISNDELKRLILISEKIKKNPCELKFASNH